jgi:beta-N-acetylhexosaminidase
MIRVNRFCLIFCCAAFSLAAPFSHAQPSLRTRIGQMVMVTVTGASLEERTPSMDTLKRDLADGLVGGIVMFNWSGNLKSPGQIAHLTAEMQRRSGIPLFLAIDEEGGKVARLDGSNGFQSTPSAYRMGTIINQEAYTRSVAATMAEWFAQTGLTLNLAPVVDLNVNPSSPAIGALERSFSSRTDTVVRHATWFIEEFRRKGVLTTLKHFPGHGSSTADSHLGFTDVTTTWSAIELEPYRQLLSSRVVDAIMTAHVFNATIDSVYPATLSQKTIHGVLRTQLGYDGVVVSDEMSMKAISSVYGLDQAAVLAVNAGVDILLYNRNLDSAGRSLGRHIVDLVEGKVADGTIAQSRIDQSYGRIMALKSRMITNSVGTIALREQPELTNFPNPFNPKTVVSCQLPVASNVKLTVYDLLGQEVAVLMDEHRPAGRYEFQFNAGGLASGVYFCRLVTADGVQTRRMLLMR